MLVLSSRVVFWDIDSHHKQLVRKQNISLENKEWGTGVRKNLGRGVGTPARETSGKEKLITMVDISYEVYLYYFETYTYIRSIYIYIY